jgi:hypothetical protein
MTRVQKLHRQPRLSKMCDDLPFFYKTQYLSVEEELSTFSHTLLLRPFVKMFGHISLFFPPFSSILTLCCSGA